VADGDALERRRVVAPNARVRASVAQFLAQRNSGYSDPEVLDSLSSMLRNKPLHGLFPAGIATGNDVLTWWVGQSGIAANTHLTIDPDKVFHVDCPMLVADLAWGVEEFAGSLDGPAGVRAAEDYWRSLWARYCPKNTPTVTWMQMGRSRGLA